MKQLSYPKEILNTSIEQLERCSRVRIRTGGRRRSKQQCESPFNMLYNWYTRFTDEEVSIMLDQLYPERIARRLHEGAVADCEAKGKTYHDGDFNVFKRDPE